MFNLFIVVLYNCHDSEDDTVVVEWDADCRVGMTDAEIAEMIICEGKNTRFNFNWSFMLCNYHDSKANKGL